MFAPWVNLAIVSTYLRGDKKSRKYTREQSFQLVKHIQIHCSQTLISYDHYELHRLELEVAELEAQVPYFPLGRSKAETEITSTW